MPGQSSTSLRLRIAADLREAIRSGRYRPGDRLPTEHELSTEYGTSRETVRAALALLGAEGLLERHRARGTFVTASPAVRVAFSLLKGGDPGRGPWETATARQGLAGEMRLVGVERRPAPDDVAALLDLDLGAPVVVRTRHALLDGRPAQLQAAHYPADLAEGTPLASPGKVEGGVYRALRAAGRVPTGVDEVVTARAATSAERDLLGLAPAVPVLVADRVTRDEAGAPVELRRVVAAADRVALVFDGLPVEGAR